MTEIKGKLISVSSSYRGFGYSGAYERDGLFEVEHLFDAGHFKIEPPTFGMWR